MLTIFIIGHICPYVERVPLHEAVLSRPPGSLCFRTTFVRCLIQNKWLPPLRRAICPMDSLSIPALVSLDSRDSDNNQKGGTRLMRGKCGHLNLSKCLPRLQRLYHNSNLKALRGDEGSFRIVRSLGVLHVYRGPNKRKQIVVRPRGDICTADG